MQQAIEMITSRFRTLRRDDYVLAGGALVLAVSIVLLLSLPLLNRVQANIRLEAIRDNAATVQLAVESYARQNLGRYPQSVTELVACLPDGEPPVNPLDGKRVAFVRRPGDVTYTLLPDGRRYRIEAWTYGPGETCRRAAILDGGC